MNQKNYPRIICIGLFLMLAKNSFSQFSRFLYPNQNLFSVFQNANQYFDSLFAAGDTLLNEEGSDYSQYRRFLEFWGPRLSTHGDFVKYSQAMKTYYNNSQNVLFANNDPWIGLGPSKEPSFLLFPSDPTNGGAYSAHGLAPVKHIDFFNANPNYMLCCSSTGGVFYSTDGGNSWNKTGTDTKIPRTGIHRIVFNPSDYKTWYAASSGGNENKDYINYTGGIFRTNDEGQNWVPIADYTALGLSTIINELKVDPANGDVLYVATNDGVYKTTNATASPPTWVQYLAGKKIYDLDINSSTPQTIYATVQDAVNGWQFMISNDGGVTWNPIASQPASVSSASALTIEFSKVNPDVIYCLIINSSTATEIWTYDSSNNPAWSQVGNTHTSFGGGFGFGICKDVLNNDLIFVNEGFCYSSSWTSESKRIKIGYPTLNMYSRYCGLDYHPDIEHFVAHPTNVNEMWMAHHGGIAKSTNGGQTWQDKSDGIAISEVLRMATAATDPSYIILATYHDGSVLSTNPYTPTNWDPGWVTVMGGDAQRPIIDPTNPKYMWTSDQGSKMYFSQDFGNNFSNLPYTGPNWIGEGVLNKQNPSTLFRSIQSSHNVIMRFPNRGILNINNATIADFTQAPFYYRAPLKIPSDVPIT